jgi:hypothetical protein
MIQAVLGEVGAVLGSEVRMELASLVAILLRYLMLKLSQMPIVVTRR